MCGEQEKEQNDFNKIILFIFLLLLLLEKHFQFRDALERGFDCSHLNSFGGRIE